MREIVFVNGIEYDAQTGQPIKNHHNSTVRSEQIHSSIQKSQTLNRKFVKMPTRTPAQDAMIQQFKRRHDYLEMAKREHQEAQSRTFDGLKRTRKIISPINHPDHIDNCSKQVSSADSVQIHPLQEKAIEKMREQKAIKVLPSAQDIKRQAILRALEVERDQAKSYKKQRGIHYHKASFFKRFAGLLSALGIFVLGSGYLVYLNLPDISTRIASMQAGTEATLPSYKPEGYKLKGLAFFDGKSVNADFEKGADKFTIKQSSSSWNSYALLENYVQPKWDAAYSTYREKGLTIYRNSNNEAAWINNGKLYTISGNNNLSSEEIAKIATSF